MKKWEYDQPELFPLCKHDGCANIAVWACRKHHEWIWSSWDCDEIRCSEHKELPGEIFTLHVWEEM